MEPRRVHDDAFHRLAELRPRLRVGVGVTRQRYRGVRWRVLHDPASNRHARLTESGYALVGLLDGRRTVAEAMRACEERLGDATPTEGEAVKLLSHLWSSDLLVGEAPPEAAMVLRRSVQRKRREWQGRLKSFLFVRIPLFDPSAALGALRPLGRGLYSWAGFVAWMVLVGGGLWAIATNGAMFLNAAAGVLAPGNLALLAAAFVAVKAAHEFGHGLACTRLSERERAPVGLRRGVGEVHEMGVMLLVLLPVPYVDASAAWAIRSKWKRAVVNAAGMHVEVGIAAAAALVFVNATPGSLASALSYNVVFLAGVTTLLFNANPLLRYDGYYILADVLEQPNLSTRGRDAVRAVVRRWAFGVRRAWVEARDGGEAALLLSYGLAAGAYKLFVAAVIVWFVSGRFFVVGVLIAVGAIATMVLAPAGKFVKYLADDAELDRRRVRAVGVTAAVVGLLVAALWGVPVADRVVAPGVVAPSAEQRVVARSDGWVEAVRGEGERVGAGELVVALRNEELLSERDVLAARLRGERVRRVAALNEGEAASAAALASRVRTLEEALERVEDQIARLSVRAEVDGVWRWAGGETLEGRFVRAGEAVGRVVSSERPIVRAVVDAGDAAGLEAGAVRGAVVLGAGAEGGYRAEAVGLSAGTRVVLPSVALAYELGGPVRAGRVEGGVAEAAEPWFELVLRPREAWAGLMLGERVWVRVEREPRPMGVQAVRAIAQAFQRRAAADGVGGGGL